MLLFKPFLIEKILTGEKTETRRLWTNCRVKVGSIHLVHPNLRASFKQEPPACKVKILSVRQEYLGAITPDAVRREGFPDGDVKRFIDGFQEINAKKHDPSRSPLGIMVWVVQFKLHHEPRQEKLL